jgi:hypothetical protein
MIDVATMPERCYTMLKSLRDFDNQELREVVHGRVSVTTTDRENCFLGNYYRGGANVQTLLSLKSAKDLQAIAMLSRLLFELAVDVRLIYEIPDAVRKIQAFSDVEKLRAATKIVRFKVANPSATVSDSIHAGFIASNAKRIQTEQAALWPGLKKVEHWSGERLPQRVARLEARLKEIYEVEYPELSWYAHSGLTGFVDLKPPTFNMLAAKQFKLAAESYEILLTAIIRETEIEKTDPRIKNKLRLAKLLPFTDSPDEADALTRAALG